MSSTQARITLDFPKAASTLVTVHTRAHSAYGSFIPTASARPSLDQINRSSKTERSRPALAVQTHLRKQSYQWLEDDDSPLSSGLSSPTIPSFSRTTSSSSVSGFTSPSFASSSKTLLNRHELRPENCRTQTDELNPILAKLERKSKLLTQKVYCATCQKVGSDYPKCGRCNAMWCSRECRMYGGKRHICNPRTLKNKQ